MCSKVRVASPLRIFLVAGSATLSVGVCAASHSAGHRDGRQGAYQDSASADRLQPMTPSLPAREVAPDFAGRTWAFVPIGAGTIEPRAPANRELLATEKPTTDGGALQGTGCTEPFARWPLATLVMPGPRTGSGSDSGGEGSTLQRNASTSFS